MNVIDPTGMDLVINGADSTSVVNYTNEIDEVWDLQTINLGVI